MRGADKAGGAFPPRAEDLIANPRENLHLLSEPMKPLRLLSALALALTALISSSLAREGTGASHVITGDLTLDRAVQAALAQNPEILKQLQSLAL